MSESVDSNLPFFGPAEGHLIAITLDAAIPFAIHDMALRGGPDWERLDRDHFADLLAERGDVLQYGGKKGEATAIFNSLAQALATMSFVPGGVAFCGRCWVAASGWPYEVCVRCRTRHAGDCPPDAQAIPPGAEVFRQGRRFIGRFTREEGRS